MKKVIALVLALAMVFALAACASNNGGSNTANTNAGGNNAAPAAKAWPEDDIEILLGYNESSPTAINAGVLGDWIHEKTGKNVELRYDATGNGANLVTDLLKGETNGTQMMVIGLDAQSAFNKNMWKDDPTDATKFAVVTGFIEPYPYSGCILLTQESQPYSTWKELEEYVKKPENKGKVTVADRAGSIMTTKIKSLFNQTGLSEYITWAPTDSAGAKTGLLGGNINIIILDETAAGAMLASPENKVKAIVNCRADNNFDYYPAATKNLDIIKKVPTLLDVFGKEKAEQYNVPNTSAIIVKAGTPAETIAQMKAVIDALGNEKESTDDKSYYVRQRNQGGTSKFYAFDGAEVMKEWQRLAPIVKEIETGSK
jgi:tripartite-type tricarboxylate transporter receptor subunit TctC